MRPRKQIDNILQGNIADRLRIDLLRELKDRPKNHVRYLLSDRLDVQLWDHLWIHLNRYLGKPK